MKTITGLAQSPSTAISSTTNQVATNSNELGITDINISSSEAIEITGTKAQKTQAQRKADGKPLTEDGSFVFTQQGSATWLYSKNIAGKNDVTHPALQISVPALQQVKISIQKTNLLIKQTEVPLTGNVQEGNITLLQVNGQMDLSTREGDIRVQGGSPQGTVRTQKGNIVLQDVSPELAALTAQGSVTRKITASYFHKNAAHPLQLLLNKEDVQIETLPNGGVVQLYQGSITIGSSQGMLQARNQNGDLTITSLQAGLRSFTQEGNVTVTLHESLLKNPSFQNASQAVEIEVVSGNLTLIVPNGFNSVLQLDHQQTSGDFHIQSQLPLVPLPQPGIESAQLKETLLGTASAQGQGRVNLRVVNGHVTIRKQ